MPISSPRRCRALSPLLLGLLAACTASEVPRGVLLITLDTMRADHLGCYGGGELTPNIDALAENGVLFLDASTPAPITLPAHTSLMTGLAPPSHGVRDNGDFRLGPDAVTLAEELGEAGWVGAAFVGATVLDSAYGLDQGFSHYDDDVRVPPGHGVTGAQSYPDRPASEVVDAALAWLQGRGEGSRFFAWVHLFDPHAPYRPPEPFRTAHGDTYAGEVAYTDTQVGRLLEGLDRMGMADDTLVILTADHGEGLGEHGETTHGFFLYQSTIQVPLILRLPGRLPASGRIPETVSLLDVLPTVEELLGLAPRSGIGGTSLVAAARGEGLADRMLYLETYLPYFQMRWSGSRGVRDGPWKYLHARGPELYDLGADPGEIEDLAASDQETARRLEDALAGMARGMPTASEAAPPALDEEERARLRSLGYLSGGGGARDDLPQIASSRPDTRDRIHLVDRLLEAAPAALDRGDPAGLRELGALVQEDPDNPRLLSIHGRALLEQGRPAEALSSLERAAALAPDDPQAEGNVAVALLRLGRSDEARMRIERSVALGGSDPETRRLRASLWIDAGEPARAEAEFQELLREQPRDAAATKGLGQALAAQKRWTEALPQLDAYLAQDPDSPEILVLTGTGLYQLRRSTEAEERFRAALAVAPDQVPAMVGLALILGERGDDAGAARILAGALALDGDNPQVLMLYGVAAARSGNVAGGRRALERALEIDPGQPRVRELLRQLGG